MDETYKDKLLSAAESLIELALAEDIGPGDATSDATLAHDTTLTGCITAKVPGVIAGLPVAELVFLHVEESIRFRPRVQDGQEVVAGEIVAEVSGPAPSLLAAERLALNFLQRMSGIATLTRDYVDAVAATDATVLDTRKTVPGHRLLDKYAVRMGGGVNHRMALFDMMLIKDNHIDGAGGLTPAVERARAARPDLPIEVEVRTLDELREALEITPPIDRIMLDNMTLPTMRQAVALTAGRVPLEASGNVTLETVADIAATGVDFISVGALTHSVQALDLSMKVTAPEQTAVSDPAGRIQEVKAALGDRLVILGHHYQRDEVIEFADYRGDSLQLSRQATETDAEVIVFCGVHFMAEVAAILAQPGQHVLIPDPGAGATWRTRRRWTRCRAAWQTPWAMLLATPNTSSRPSPTSTPRRRSRPSAGSTAASSAPRATRQMSSDGRWRGGPASSSSPTSIWGATRPRAWASQRRRCWSGISGTRRAARISWQAKVVLWPGACNVHQRFRPEHVRAVRARYPDGASSSIPNPRPRSWRWPTTPAPRRTSSARSKPRLPGPTWAIGTETRLVRRLQQEHPDQTLRLAGRRAAVLRHDEPDHAGKPCGGAGRIDAASYAQRGHRGCRDREVGQSSAERMLAL